MSAQRKPGPQLIKVRSRVDALNAKAGVVRLALVGEASRVEVKHALKVEEANFFAEMIPDLRPGVHQFEIDRALNLGDSNPAARH